jgi:hypothetical protein
MRYTRNLAVIRSTLAATVALGAGVLLLLRTAPLALANPTAEGQVLFDGKTLDGWEGHEKYRSALTSSRRRSTAISG